MDLVMYDVRLSDAKRAVTSELCRIVGTKANVDLDHLTSSIDTMNQMWDQLTDCLRRQRDERDEQILRLINELAEAKKDR